MGYDPVPGRILAKPCTLPAVGRSQCNSLTSAVARVWEVAALPLAVPSLAGAGDAAAGGMRSCLVPGGGALPLSAAGTARGPRSESPRAGCSPDRAASGRGLIWACLGLFRPEPAFVFATAGIRGDQRGAASAVRSCLAGQSSSRDAGSSPHAAALLPSVWPGKGRLERWDSCLQRCPCVCPPALRSASFSLRSRAGAERGWGEGGVGGGLRGQAGSRGCSKPRSRTCQELPRYPVVRGGRVFPFAFVSFPVL